MERAAKLRENLTTLKHMIMIEHEQPFLGTTLVAYHACLSNYSGVVQGN